MSDSAQRWPTPWIRASLDLAILTTLLNEDLHGYAIASALEDLGMGRLKGGSLYPSLAKLEEAGFIEATWQPASAGPGRKTYAITTSGRKERQRLADSWRELSDILTQVHKQGARS